jgi:hypothetical protein
MIGFPAHFAGIQTKLLTGKQCRAGIPPPHHPSALILLEICTQPTKPFLDHTLFQVSQNLIQADLLGDGYDRLK